MKPNISEYMNIFQFLQDHYAYRKGEDLSFSYAKWASELGLKNKSYLRFVVLGKRPLNTKLMVNLKENLCLSVSEQNIFQILSLYSQSRSDEQRKILGKELIQTLKAAPAQEDLQNHHEILMSPLALMIRTLLTFKDIKKTAQNLSEILEAEIMQINEALEILEQLELVEKKDNQYFGKTKHLKIPDNLSSFGLEEFYRKSFTKASEALNTTKHTRKYRSWYVALSEDDFQKFTLENEQSVREKVLAFDSDFFEQKRLYQVLLTTIPVTQK